MSKKEKKHSTTEENKQCHTSENPAENKQDKATSPETTSAEEVSVESPAPEKDDSIQKELDDVKAKYAQLNDTYLRTLAEYDNYRKRSIREKADLIKSGGESVLKNILPVVDDFERGLAVMDNAKDMDAVKEGMNLIYNKLQGFLKQNGISVIETENQPFDTDLHEAITTIPTPDESMKGKIIDCVQKGYFLHDKVIRYSKVVVGN